MSSVEEERRRTVNRSLLEKAIMGLEAIARTESIRSYYFVWSRTGL